jgi:hypothetical protein
MMHVSLNDLVVEIVLKRNYSVFHEVFEQVSLNHVEYFAVIFEMNHYDVIDRILVMSVVVAVDYVG